MAWTYSDWRSQTTTAAQIARLKLHIQELTDAFGPNVSGSDMSVDRSALPQMIQALELKLAELERSPSLRVGGGVSYARIRD